MFNFKILTALLIGILLTGCGYHEQIVQRNEQSYIQFLGPHNGETIVIDGGSPYKLMGSGEPANEGDFVKDYIPALTSFTIKGIQATKILVKKGKHNVKVYRRNNETNNALLTEKDLMNNDNNLVIDKDIFISSGTTYEFEL